MNKNYLILLIVILAIIAYNCFKKEKTTENMNTVSGSIFLRGDKLEDVYNLSVAQVKQIPTIDKKIKKYINLAKDEIDEETDDEIDEQIQETVEEENVKPLDPIWEEKRMPAEKIVKILQKRLDECGITNLKINLKDVIGLRNRKRFIQLLPIFRDDIKKKINYDQIKCFISKYEPDNYITIAKTQSVLPRYLPYRNLVMINNFLYQFTPYGVLKYSLPKNPKVDDNDSVVIGSMEASLINDVNKMNDSSRIIIPLKGKLYQIRKGKFFNIRTGEHVDIIGMIRRLYKKRMAELKKKRMESKRKLLAEEEQMEEEDYRYYKYYDEYIEYKNKYLNLKEKYDRRESDFEEEEETLDLKKKVLGNYDEEQDEEMDSMKKKLIAKKAKLPEEFFRRTLYVINHEKEMYIVKPKRIIPNMGLGKPVNAMIKKHDIIIRGVMPHFYNGVDGKFHITYLFLCNNNFYFTFNDGRVSRLQDFRKDFNFFFSRSLKYELSCLEHRTILNQLVETNKISVSRKNAILNRMKCYNNESMPAESDYKERVMSESESVEEELLKKKI